MIRRCDICGHSGHDQKDCDQRPIVRMQPRDETAERMEFERAKRLVESYGWTVTAPESVGCESIGQRA